MIHPTRFPIVPLNISVPVTGIRSVKETDIVGEGEYQL